MAWMPGAVLIAKSTYVWLAQLSRQYGRHIGRLDEIPDEELATLAHRGINSLWLIGVWERSRASKTIKQLCGNAMPWPQPTRSSTTALPTIWAASRPTSTCATAPITTASASPATWCPTTWASIRPGSSSIPEWFISRWDSPYPAYSFNGPDLSHDGRVEIKIEDHYYEQSDAAVVFRRRDKSTGETRYIYHGNDGTSFPWNDTAQLDYLNAAVREQVIQTILHVARLFPGDPFRRRHDAGQAALSPAVVSGAGIERRHSFSRRVRNEPGRFRPRDAA